MTTQPTSYLLPKDTLDNLRTLAKDVGNMSGVLLHAIDTLESSLTPLATKTPEDQIGELLSRFDGVALSLGQIATRVEALESHGSEVVKAESSLPPMAESAPMNVHEKTGKDAPQADTTAADQDKKTNRRDYSLDIRRMAVDMRKKGKKSADIIIAIHSQCGYAPDKSNLQTRLNRWEKELDSSSAPLAQDAVSPSRSTVADQSEPLADSGDVGKDTPQADANTTATPDKRIQRNYPPEVRKMAVDMRRKGKSSDAIISAIHKKCGYAPSISNLTTYLNRWENAK
ncbi:hypothetical protein CCP4SC76_1690005 [Gammaproteobacteria bacterium]